MAWTNLSFAFGSQLTSPQMNQLYNNFAALATGSSGAPKVLNAALNSYPWGNSALSGYPWGASDLSVDAIVRSRIKTATVSLSGTIPIEGSVSITLHAYAFTPSIAFNGSGGPVEVRARETTAAPDSPTFDLHNLSSDFVAFYDVKYRYIVS